MIGWPFLQLYFLSLKPIESFLGCVFGIIVSLKCPPSFHLHHLCRWQQIFIKNVSVHFSIHPSFNYMNFFQCYTMIFWGDVQCHLISKHGVYYGIQRVQFFVSSDQTIFCQYFIGLSKCCAANFKSASTCFFFINRALCGERAYRPWQLSAIFIVFFETIIHANSRFF